MKHITVSIIVGVVLIVTTVSLDSTPVKDTLSFIAGTGWGCLLSGVYQMIEDIFGG